MSSDRLNTDITSSSAFVHTPPENQLNQCLPNKNDLNESTDFQKTSEENVNDEPCIYCFISSFLGKCPRNHTDALPVVNESNRLSLLRRTYMEGYNNGLYDGKKVYLDVLQDDVWKFIISKKSSASDCKPLAPHSDGSHQNPSRPDGSHHNPSRSDCSRQNQPRYDSSHQNPYRSHQNLPHS